MGKKKTRKIGDIRKIGEIGNIGETRKLMNKLGLNWAKLSSDWNWALH